MNILSKSALLLVAFLFVLSCADDNSSNVNDISETTDYSVSSNWAHISNDIVCNADIFYLHPTTYYGDSEDATNNWEISQYGQPAEYIYATIVSQVSMFDSLANPFVPCYRQMNMNIAFSDTNEHCFNVAYSDVKAAFLYYYEHYNDGRPFFIMGHSQGAHMALRLIEDLFDDKQYADKLIAAYIVGWPVTQETLAEYPHIKVLKTPAEFGGVVPWDVVAENVSALYPTVAPNSIIINPLTWTDSREPIPAEENLGAAFFDVQGFDYVKTATVPGFTGGQIKTMPPIPDVFPYEYEAFVTPDLNTEMLEYKSELDHDAVLGCYHVIASELFYENIRANIALRLQSYINAND